MPALPKSGTGITGSSTGTTNTIPKYISATTLGNSSITDNGTIVSFAEPEVFLASATLGAINPQIGQDGSGILRLNSASGVNLEVGGAGQVALTSSNLSLFSAKAVVTSGGKFDAYNAILTAGLGVPAIYGLTLQKSETGAADNNVLIYTPPATAGTYRASMSLDVSASTAGICGWTITYKDSNGNAQAPVNIIMFASGVLAGGLTLTVAANGHYFGYMDFDIDNSATNIVIKFTYTSGTLAAKMTARVEQLG
jgi:hypothetical protein